MVSTVAGPNGRGIGTNAEMMSLLGRLDVKPLSTEEQRALLDCSARLEKTEYPKNSIWVPSCPYCSDCGISGTDTSWHIERCERHPQRLRYERLRRVAAHLANAAGRVDEEAATPAATFLPPHPLFPIRLPLAEAVQVLGTRAEPQRRDDAIWTIRRELRWRLHVTDPSTDGCPWCRSLFSAEVFIKHLWNCPEHPGEKRGAVLEDRLRERFGDDAFNVAVEAVREGEARAMLTMLITASRTYASSLGFMGEGQYYSKVWTERPWRRVMDLAKHFAEAEGAVPMIGRMETLVALTSKLAKTCLNFWNGMRDDTDRSLIDATKCAAWEAEVTATEAALTAMG